MKEKFEDILGSIFSIFIIIAVLGGGVIFTLLLIAIIIGGDAGTTLATTASSKIMPYFIKAAAIGVLAGLITFYVHGNHHLSLKK